MGLPPPTSRYSVQEYLQGERIALDKHEFRDGEILMMPGGTAKHSLIIANISREIGNRLKGKPCHLYESNLRVSIPRRRVFTYPDATVICGPPQPDPNDPAGETMINPRLIVEVLSPTTEAYDRGEKFNGYRELDSLMEYVLVSQDTPRVETFFRQSEGTWLVSPVSGLGAVVKLRSLEIELPLAEVFAGVKFSAAQVTA